MAILEKADGVGWLMELDSGNTMYAFKEVGHSDADLLETVRSIEGDDMDGEFLDITEGAWGWSPRFKNCSNHDSGWGCDNEGEWHRHYSQNYGHDPVTCVTIRRRAPQQFEGLAYRVIPVPILTTAVEARAKES